MELRFVLDKPVSPLYESASDRAASRASGELSIYQSLLAIALIWLLLREWLEPLIEMSGWTRVYVASPFLTAFATFLLLDMMKLRGWFVWPLKILAIHAVIAFYYQQEHVLSVTWWSQWLELLRHDMGLFAAGSVDAVSPELRTALLLCGWAMSISGIYAVIIYRQMAGWFVGSTLLYLLILQLWPGVDTTGGVVRTAAVGLLLLSLLQAKKVERLFEMGRTQASLRWGWYVCAISLAAACWGVGLWLTGDMHETARPLNLPGLQELGSQQDRTGAGKRTAQMGYGVDDSELGNSVENNHEVVFWARTSKLTYWRGQAKEIYTGRGWETGRSSYISYPDQASAMDESSERIVQEVVLANPKKGNTLFVGGEVLQLEEVSDEEGKSLQSRLSWNPSTGEWKMDNRQAAAYYRWVVKSGPMAAQSDHMKPYLQLPDDLPDRVRSLALQITDLERNDADKAAAIERYLRSSYSYSLTESEVPPKGQDFVDHFLFQQKSGYCDHFSTSMVVMLRASGIPARWVKGFAPGEGGKPGENEMIPVTVKNSDAHSWVEAYIDGTGWVSFEPTPAYEGAATVQAAGEQEQQFMEAILGGAIAASSVESSLMSESDQDRDLLAPLRANVLNLVVTAAVIILFVVLLFFKLRRKRMTHEISAERWQIVEISAKHLGKAEVRSMRKLMKLLKRTESKYGSPLPTETWREYIMRIPWGHDGEKQVMQEMASVYEACLYQSEREGSSLRVPTPQQLSHWTRTLRG